MGQDKDFEGLDLNKEKLEASNNYALVDREQLNILSRLVYDYTKYNKVKLYFSIFFKFIFWGVIISIIYFTFTKSQENLIFNKNDINNKNQPSIGLIKIQGPIIEGGLANADSVIKSLKRAYENHNTKMIILEINSSGGSPVQSSLVYDEIIRLKKKHKQRDIKVYTVVKDAALSGAYYIAVAADKIYANKNSLVGSIGVILASFNFEELLKEFGIKRVILKSGENKDLLDPFQTNKNSNISHIQKILDNIHENFIKDVKAQRKNKLSSSVNLYTGLFWDARQAKDLGLIDGFADVQQLAEKQGNIDIINYTNYRNYWDELADSLF